MRIRKRQVPLPLSSLLPVPLSDLYFHRSPASTDCDGGAPPPPPPSDISDRLIRRWDTDGCGFADHGAHDDDAMNLAKKVKPLGDDKVEDEEEEETDKIGSKNADADAGAETAGGNTSRESNSSSQGTWSDREKIAPLKKRRDHINSCQGDNNKVTQVIMKSEAKDVGKGRKKGRGGALAEGSRCSRVNGRGWRCCQQTLVGYSLCEHHLGKGRLRSMSASARKCHRNNRETISQSIQSHLTTTTTMKKVKLGMVKARSISSLLGQTTSGGGGEIVAPADHYGDGDK